MATVVRIRVTKRPLLAFSGHTARADECPLSGAKRTLPFALHMSANDPKRTWASETERPPRGGLSENRSGVFNSGKKGDVLQPLHAPVMGMLIGSRPIAPVNGAYCQIVE